MTSEQRRSSDNGIWLCDVHARAVDAKDSKFSIELLHEWRRKTNEDSWRSVMHDIPFGPGMQVRTPDELRERLRAAATADLDVFRRTAKWPSTPVALTLRVDHLDEALSTRALANAVTTLDDLVLVAPPGMGKTTTLFQIAEGTLETGNGAPLVVPLGDWATEGATLLNSILKRPAFREISEDDFRTAVASPGVVLLLDGWNELDGVARERARVQVAALKAELPELGLVISTRKLALDVPFIGTRVELLPLNETQQIEIAKSLRGEAGEKIVDQAWRTPGVRELVTIPLYLTALLALPDGAPFPTTREEVLRRFVAAHEQDARRAEALRAVVHGFQQDYLGGLAVLATSTANTAIVDSSARRSIADTAHILAAEGQITITFQPDALLDVLVNNHVLMRAGDTPGYSFQHQQFQEWYASHSVERLMLEAVGSAASRDRLKADILNKRPWEEAILFAVERLARGNQAQQNACGVAILAAFEVDPILAAEMIFRATDEAWSQISAKVQSFIRNWHTAGKVDRALRFMITCGRPEFIDLIWPLITHEDDQKHLSALRAARQFRPSLLGSDGPKRIAALPPEIRKNVLHEIASNSGVDGLNFVTAIAKADSDPEVKATVVDALAFRRADRHVAEVLSTADDKTYDLVVAEDLIDDVSVESIQKDLHAARERKRRTTGNFHSERLRSLIYEQGDHAAEVAIIIAEMEIDRKRDSDTHLLYEVRQRYPRALAEGLLTRLQKGRTLFYGADDVLASAGFVLECDKLLDTALAETGRRDDRADAAASVLGPKAVGRVVEALLHAKGKIRVGHGRYDQAARERYHDLRIRIEHMPGGSLIAAIRTRSEKASNEEIAEFAKLLSRKSYGEDDRERPFNAEELNVICELAKEWGERMLEFGDTAPRWQVASIATLISHTPSVALLPLLKKLLDDNLRRFRAFREQAKANGWRPGEAVNEARAPHMHEYLWAFLAIKAAETSALMEEYLTDEDFGELAATVLTSQWIEANEPKDDERFRRDVDFSRVRKRRAARAADPTATSVEAEAIFRVIESLTTAGSTEDQNKLAVSLGILAARLPHGQRDATIQNLISLAPRQRRAALLLNLILSGEDIDIKIVADGIAQVFAAAKKDAWMLTQSNAYELREWLRLLPFTNRPADALSVVRGMPDAQRHPELLGEMVECLGEASSAETEEVLFRLAEEDPRFYQNHRWQDTVMRLGTSSSALRIIDLTAQGALGGKATDDRQLARELGGLIGEFAEVRAYVYDVLKAGPMSRDLALLAEAVAENPDAQGLLILIELEMKHKQSYMSWRTIENVVTDQAPSESWKGAYDVVPIPATELRKRLLALTTDGGPDDAAARYLNAIDKVRDRYGAPESEPRHPDLLSDRPWPIMVSDPNAASVY